ncbi:hypothetical protein [Tsukamurella hominis]|uniref:hypothetical protein n=1 Tax=Tsukamurella hominis TaxID=1970232 RepID=UPI0039EB00BA
MTKTYWRIPATAGAIGLCALLLTACDQGELANNQVPSTTFATITATPPDTVVPVTPQRPVPPPATGTTLPPVPQGAPPPGADGLPPLPPPGAPAPGPDGQPPSSTARAR